MIGVTCLLKRWKTIRRRRRFTFAKGRQICNGDTIILMHDHNPLNRISQFPYVTWPRITLHDFNRVGVEYLRFLSIRSGKSAVEVIDQQRHILDALPQWRYFERNY